MDQHPDIVHLDKVSKIMDGLFEVPGLRWRVGLDGLLGLIPGVGDFVGFAVSGYFVIVAARLNISRLVLSRMVVNVLIDALIGAIPFVGDLFDFAWKANRKNLELLKQSTVDAKSVERRSMAFFVMLIAGLILLGCATLYGIWLLTAALLKLIGL